MMNTLAKELPLTARVTERLLAQHGADLLWQVERLSPRFFRAWMNDGRVLLVTVLDNGELATRALEDPA